MVHVSVVCSGQRMCFVSFAILLSAVLMPKCTLVLSQAYVRHQGVVHYQHDDGAIHTLAWAVKIRFMQTQSLQNVSQIAQEMELINAGQIGAIQDYYLFIHPFYFPNTNDSKISNTYKKENKYTSRAVFFAIKNETENKLLTHPAVLWFKQEIMRHRSKRQLEFQDPYFPNQWHLVSDNI